MRSYPDLNYQLIHGIRYAEDAYEKDHYERSRIIICTSRDTRGDYEGRLTKYLKQTDFDKNSCFYLCGNSDMIFDSMEILKEKGFDRDSVNVEVYF